MAMAPISIPIAHLIEASSFVISSTGTDWRLGLTNPHSQVATGKEKRRGLVSTNGLMALGTLGNGS